MEQQLHTDIEFLCNFCFEEDLLQLVKSLVTSLAEARDLVLWPTEVLSIFVEALEDCFKGRSIGETYYNVHLVAKPQESKRKKRTISRVTNIKDK